MERSIKNTLPELSRGLDESLPFPKSGNSARLSSGINSFMVVGAFLQQPALFFSEIRDGINLPQKIWMLLVSSTIFLAVYGAVLGVGHPYLSFDLAITMPFLFLASLATCIPVMYLLDVLSGSQRSLSQMVAVLLTSISAAGTVFFSFAPIMVVFRITGTIPQYFSLNLGILAMATLIGLIYVTQGLIQTAIVDASHNLSGVNRRLHFLWMLLFLMVISQLGWSLLSFYQRTGGFLGALL